MRRLNGLLLIVIVMMPIFCGLSGTQAAQESSHALVVTSARVAVHDDVTRLVFDISSSLTYKISSDPSSKVIEIDLPELNWQLPAHSLENPIGLLKYVHYDKNQSGSAKITIGTDSPSFIFNSFIIPPTAGNNYRLVFDMKRRDINSSLSQNEPKETTSSKDSSEKPVSYVKNGGAVVKIPPPLANDVRPDPAGKTDKTNVKSATKAYGKPIIIIDPGHGGVDPGATSLSGVYEKNIVLALAQELADSLNKHGKVKAILTRDHDIFIPLRQRVAIARSQNADLFISLHADIVSDHSISGLSVYTLSQTASDSEAQALADKENKSDIVAGVNLSDESHEVANILIDLIQRDSMNHSALFAHQIISSVSKETKELLENTHRFAGFAVLKAPDIPSVLIECGYLSNQRDEQMLLNVKYRVKLANAISHAVEQYFNSPPKG